MLRFEECIMSDKLHLDIWKRIFHLSDQAMIRMVNHIFCTEYGDRESVLREWDDSEYMNVSLVIGGTHRYEFRIRCMRDLFQICAEDKGCVFHHTEAARRMEVQECVPVMTGSGSGMKEDYCMVLNLSEQERVLLPVHLITLSSCPVSDLADAGLILFIPFLFTGFRRRRGTLRDMQRTLKYFVIHDILGELQQSVKRGDLTIYDGQKLKQLCLHMVWRCLAREEWMQDLEFQESLLNLFETDIALLERVHRKELGRLRDN